MSGRDAVTGPAMRFMVRDGDRVSCVVCHEDGGVHLPTCAVVELDVQVRELLAHVGAFVANIQETLETIGRVIRDQ